MPFLIIDTSTERSLVALAEGKELIFSHLLPFGPQSSRSIFDPLQNGLKERGIEISDLDAIGVAKGPGSFTGIRVGVALALGLSAAKNIPLIGFNTLEGFISQKEGRFASVIDARIGGAYCLIQERKGDEIFPLGEAELCSIEILSEKIAGCQQVVGPALGRFNLPHAVEVPPDATQLAKIVYARFCNQAFVVDRRLSINYLRSI